MPSSKLLRKKTKDVTKAHLKLAPNMNFVADSQVPTDQQPSTRVLAMQEHQKTDMRKGYEGFQDPDNPTHYNPQGAVKHAQNIAAKKYGIQLTWDDTLYILAKVAGGLHHFAPPEPADCSVPTAAHSLAVNPRPSFQIRGLSDSLHSVPYAVPHAVPHDNTQHVPPHPPPASNTFLLDAPPLLPEMPRTVRTSSRAASKHTDASSQSSVEDGDASESETEFSPEDTRESDEESREPSSAPSDDQHDPDATPKALMAPRTKSKVAVRSVGHIRARSTHKNIFLPNKMGAAKLWEHREKKAHLFRRAISWMKFEQVPEMPSGITTGEKKKRLAEVKKYLQDLLTVNYRSAGKYENLTNTEKKRWKLLSEVVREYELTFRGVSAENRMLLLDEKLGLLHQDAYSAFGVVPITICFIPASPVASPHGAFFVNSPDPDIPDFLQFLKDADPATRKAFNHWVSSYCNVLWTPDMQAAGSGENDEDTDDDANVPATRSNRKEQKKFALKMKDARWDGCRVWIGFGRVKLVAQEKRDIYRATINDRAVHAGYRTTPWTDVNENLERYVDVTNFPTYIAKNGEKKNAKLTEPNKIKEEEVDRWLEWFSSHEKSDDLWLQTFFFYPTDHQALLDSAKAVFEEEDSGDSETPRRLNNVPANPSKSPEPNLADDQPGSDQDVNDLLDHASSAAAVTDPLPDRGDEHPKTPRKGGRNKNNGKKGASGAHPDRDTAPVSHPDGSFSFPSSRGPAAAATPATAPTPATSRGRPAAATVTPAVAITPAAAAAATHAAAAAVTRAAAAAVTRAAAAAAVARGVAAAGSSTNSAGSSPGKVAGTRQSDRQQALAGKVSAKGYGTRNAASSTGKRKEGPTEEAPAPKQPRKKTKRA